MILTTNSSARAAWLAFLAAFLPAFVTFLVGVLDTTSFESDALIGINNRDLKTLNTDINTTFNIHNVLVNHPGPLISESGIKTKEELLELSNKTSIKTFLIGESLLNDLENNSIFSVL